MPTKPAKPKPVRKMPKFKPAPEVLKKQFAQILSKYPEAQARTMFSYPAGFVNGQMFMSIFGDSVMLRLSDEDRANFLKLPNSKLFEPMPGRPMKEYVEVPKTMLADPKEMNKWVVKSLGYAQALPPKKSKKK